MTSPRRTLLLIGPLVGITLLTGCGGGAKSNGVDKLSATAALTKVKTAVAAVHSVHVSGQFTQGGQTLSLDVSLGDSVADGTVHLGGGQMELRLVAGVTYFRADSKVLTAFGANAAQAGLTSGRWIKDTGSSGPGASFATFLDRKQLFDALLTPQGTLSTGGTTTVDGRKALVLVDSSANGGKLYVATTGAAVPLRVEKTGGGGRIDFTDYNVAVHVAAPPGAVDLSQLNGG